MADKGKISDVREAMEAYHGLMMGTRTVEDLRSCGCKACTAALERWFRHRV